MNTERYQSGNVECEINMSKENIIMYNGDIYKITDINSYDSIGILDIDLKKIK